MHQRTPFRTMAIAIGAVFSMPAVAQDVPHIDVQRFDPAPQAGSFVLVPDADPDANPRFGFSAALNYGYHPLIAADVGADGVGQGVVDHLVGADLVLHGSPVPFLAFGAQVPVLQGLAPESANNTIADQLGGVSAGVGFGDIALSMRFLPVRRSAAQVFSLGVGPRVVLPTGTRRRFVGSGGVGVGAELFGSARWPMIHATAQLGFQVQTSNKPTGDVVADDELRYGIGLGVPFAQNTWRMDLEWTGATVTAPAARELLGSAFDAQRHTPMEGLLGFLHEPANLPMWVKVGVGAGLTRAFGTPDARLFVQMGYQADGRGRRLEPEPGLVDTDRDGIFDVADACVRDPEEQPLVEGDDGCPEIDTDRDGIVDGLDRCPLLAEDLDAFQDEEGCPDPDNDGDSVPDTRDGHRNPDTSVMMLPSLGIGDCANVAETWNGKEDQDGCPDAGLVEVRGDRIVLFEPVYFDTNLATIRPESAALLSEVAAVMQTWPQIERVEVQGHADARGADLDNYALSDARAAAVRLWLIQRGGVAPERLIARGYGEDRPMIPSADSPGELALNRRVQLVILKMRDGGPKTLVGR